MCFCPSFFMTSNTLIEWSETEEFVPPVTSGQVIKVYDGDTITIASGVPYNKKLFRFQIRLAGIDTEEMHGPNKNAALVAKNTLANLILGHTVELKNIKNEKYGRLLADVYFENIHINNWMIQKGHAIKYNGGNKLKAKQDAEK
jgi:endonuclease YncB( thermonuclease family)